MTTATKEQWSPKDEKNPYRVWSMMIAEEWLEITRWYPFSVRALIVLGQNNASRSVEWHEQARTGTWEKAKEIMRTLGAAREGEAHVQGFVVMKCERRGKEGRERPVLWYPSQGELLSRLRDLGLIKQGENG